MRDIMIRIEGRDPIRLSDCLCCSRCRDTLYPGDDYYEIGEETLCEECFDDVVRRMRKVVGA